MKEEDKPLCPYCYANGKEATNVVFLKSQNKWKCNNCGAHFYLGILEI